VKFNVEKYYEDIRKILQSKFDCRNINVDDVVHNTVINMLSTEDYDPKRAGPSTYIFFKLRTTYLNYFQKKNKSKEILMEENAEAFQIPEEINEIIDSDFTEFIKKSFTDEQRNNKLTRLCSLLNHGYTKQEITKWLHESSSEVEELLKKLKETRITYQNK
jgi:DNA-directed RNA polymerase specialized sigma24 family protein